MEKHSTDNDIGSTQSITDGLHCRRCGGKHKSELCMSSIPLQIWSKRERMCATKYRTALGRLFLIVSLEQINQEIFAMGWLWNGLSPYWKLSFANNPMPGLSMCCCIQFGLRPDVFKQYKNMAIGKPIKIYIGYEVMGSRISGKSTKKN